MIIASRIGYAMITEKMATPLYDEKSAKFRVCAIIKARNIALAIMARYHRYAAKMKLLVISKVR